MPIGPWSLAPLAWIRWLACALATLCATGCTSFPLPPFDYLAADASARTFALRCEPIGGRPLNRAAMLQSRSQLEIKCRLEALWNPSQRLGPLINHSGLLATRYSQLDTEPGPAFRHGILNVQHLGQRESIQYIAAFHAGRRLPLVIGVSGINSTVDGKVAVDILQSLYDSGEFHVIHLEAMTNVDQIVRNQRPFAGGFPEGLLLYESIVQLRSEFADQIAQVHLLGVSFGGLLCGVAAHCEDHFQSGAVDGAVLAFSPPLDLRQLFKNLAAFPYIHDRVHDTYLVDGLERFVRRGYLDASVDPTQVDFDEYMRTLALPYVQSVYPALKQSFPELPPVQTAHDLYAISSMRPFFGKLGVPYFYYYAYDDPVLSPDDHFHRVLAECRNPLVDGILLPDGGHLGFDAVCDYPFTSRVALEYFRYWSMPRPAQTQYKPRRN